MTETSPRLSLPYLMPSQAQKHVTHNEALQRLDLLVQLSVTAFGADAPPADPAIGAAYALGAAPTGAWAGQGGDLALWQGSSWQFVTPQPGWRARGAEDGSLRVWDGGAWVVPPLQNLDSLGIGAQADAVNRLSLTAEAALFNHAGSDHRLKINKAAETATAALLLQSDWDGHAELGLAGSNDFSLRVSADGSSWVTALTAQAASGHVGLGTDTPAAPLEVAGSNGTLAQISGSGANLDITDVNATARLRSVGGRLHLSADQEDAIPGSEIRFFIDNDQKAVLDGTGRMGIGTGAPAAPLHISSSDPALTGAVAQITALPAPAAAFDLLRAGASGGGDTLFRLGGNGNAACDGSWSGGGADYAEYFEWADGNPDAEDRRGLAVVLQAAKIRPAQPGEEPFAVISGHPAVIGGGDCGGWTGKYLRDAYGSLLEQEGPDGPERVLNPEYDPKAAYLPRAQRPEWALAGLLGRLRLNRGQPVAARWIRLRAVSADVEEWLLR